MERLASEEFCQRNTFGTPVMASTIISEPSSVEGLGGITPGGIHMTEIIKIKGDWEEVVNDCR